MPDDTPNTAEPPSIHSERLAWVTRAIRRYDRDLWDKAPDLAELVLDAARRGAEEWRRVNGR